MAEALQQTPISRRRLLLSLRHVPVLLKTRFGVFHIVRMSAAKLRSKSARRVFCLADINAIETDFDMPSWATTNCFLKTASPW